MFDHFYLLWLPMKMKTKVNKNYQNFLKYW